MKSSVLESNTREENLKYAYCTVVRGCYYSEERLWTVDTSIGTSQCLAMRRIASKKLGIIWKGRE